MDVGELRKHYSRKKGEIKERLNDFKQNKDHFYEFCFCLLTPQSNAYKCDDCITILRNRDFLNKDFKIEKILQKHTRFYRNKSKYLLLFRDKSMEIFQSLNKLKSNKEKRDYDL